MSDTGNHPHPMVTGDMYRCSVCHRQWQRDDDPPPCEPVYDDGSRPAATPSKRQGWRGPGDHGKTRTRTPNRLRR